MDREWYDTALLLLYIYFGYFKAWKLDTKSNLGRSFRIYNIVISTVFSLSIVVIPLIAMPDWLAQGALTVGRLAMLLAILWCIRELEAVNQTPRMVRVIVTLCALAVVAVLLFLL